MPKLLFVVPGAYPQGGVATWLDYLAPGLEAQAHQVTIAIVSGKHHDAKNYLEKHPFANYHEVKNRTGSYEGRIRSLLELLQVNKPDFVISVNIPDIYLAVSRLKCQSEYVPYLVMTLHGFNQELLLDAKKYQDVLDAVICTNRLTCRLVELHSGIEKNKIFYAPYGVDVSNESSKDQSNSQLVIAYSGRLDREQKRARDLPQIIQQLAKTDLNFKFLLAGSGPELDYIRQHLGHQIDRGTVELFEWLDPQSLTEKIYKKADVLLITSLWETGPIVAWEAITNNVAILTTKYIGINSEGSLVDNYNCLTYEIGDSNAAVQALQRLSDQALRQRLVDNARILVQDRYNKQNSVIQFDQALDKISQTQKSDKIIKEQPVISGRLDKYFGINLAESLRKLFNYPVIHPDPGSEWSHTHSRSLMSESDYLKMLKNFEHSS